MSTTVPELSNLAPPSVVEPLDFENILAAHRADLIARYPAAADVIHLESEPLAKLLEAHAYRELLFRARVNDAARAHLLAFATGTDLDHLAALFGIVRMPGESDERLRTRLQLRIAALAGNGTKEHYEYTALTASGNVRAAIATQPRPGAVHVVLWLHSPDADTAAKVLNAINADNVRMMGVQLSTGLARPRAIDIRARIWSTPGAAPQLLQLLQMRLNDAFASTAALGRTVARSWITTQLHADGVASVDYAEDHAAPPAATTLEWDEYPILGAVQLTDAGVL